MNFYRLELVAAAAAAASVAVVVVAFAIGLIRKHKLATLQDLEDLEVACELSELSTTPPHALWHTGTRARTRTHTLTQRPRMSRMRPTHTADPPLSRASLRPTPTRLDGWTGMLSCELTGVCARRFRSLR